MKIDLSHGSGGIQTSNLIHDIFLKHFHNSILDKLEDSAILNVRGKIAYTTDSFVVTPMFFPGGDIGKIAVCGTVNDLSVMGAIPKFLTAGFIIEEGTDLEILDRIAASMEKAAREARVKIVAGDTKVIEGNGGVYINTSGIGEVVKRGVSIAHCRPGDVMILSGNLGEHHAAIYSKRMGIQNEIQSDCAPLNQIVTELMKENISIHCMRDVTRGGLATVLNEISAASACRVEIEESSLPISKEIRGFSDILGLDPLYMANEGKMIVVIPKKQAQQALMAVRRNKYGKRACMIGEIKSGNKVVMKTRLLGERVIDVLYGEGLPRIC